MTRVFGAGSSHVRVVGVWKEDNCCSELSVGPSEQMIFDSFIDLRYVVIVDLREKSSKELWH